MMIADSFYLFYYNIHKNSEKMAFKTCKELKHEISNLEKCANYEPIRKTIKAGPSSMQAETAKPSLYYS